MNQNEVEIIVMNFVKIFLDNNPAAAKCFFSPLSNLTSVKTFIKMFSRIIIDNFSSSDNGDFGKTKIHCFLKKQKADGKTQVVFLTYLGNEVLYEKIYNGNTFPQAIKRIFYTSKVDCIQVVAGMLYFFGSSAGQKTLILPGCPEFSLTASTTENARKNLSRVIEWIYFLRNKKQLPENSRLQMNLFYDARYVAKDKMMELSGWNIRKKKGLTLWNSRKILLSREDLEICQKTVWKTVFEYPLIKLLWERDDSQKNLIELMKQIVVITKTDSPKNISCELTPLIANINQRLETQNSSRVTVYDIIDFLGKLAEKENCNSGNIDCVYTEREKETIKVLSQQEINIIAEKNGTISFCQPHLPLIFKGMWDAQKDNINQKFKQIEELFYMESSPFPKQAI